MDGTAKIASPLVHLRVRLPDEMVCVFERTLGNNRAVSQESEIFRKRITSIEDVEESGESTRCVQINVTKNRYKGSE